MLLLSLGLVLVFLALAVSRPLQPDGVRGQCFRASMAALALAGTAAHADAPAPAEARAIARQAVIYGFPLVDNYRVMHSYFVDSGGPEFKAPWNMLNNVDRVYTPKDTSIQTPNSDTPYSQLGVDLRAEPLVLTVPAVEHDRYYSLQFIDLYTFNFAYVGSRATGSAAGNYLLAGPGWKGKVPPGIDKVIRSETELAFVLYRTQLRNPGDIEKVKAVQAGYKVQPLSAFLKTAAPPPAPAIVFPKPLSADEERSSLDFFGELNFLLQFAPTHPSEAALRERFAKIGIVPGKPFDVGALSPEMRQALADGMADAWKTLAAYKKDEIDTGKRTSADGFGTRDFLHGDYLARMASAAFGIYGNSKEEAIYPAYFVDSKGQPMDGSKHAYRLRFAPGALPPAKAFWSITMYQLPSSLLVDNALDRYLINSAMLSELKRDKDGGITLYLQADSPGKALETNWLPAPKGPFWSAMRLYWPKAEALDGRWKQPALVRVADTGAARAGGAAVAAASVPVNVENFARAESDLYFAGVVANGGFGKFDHTRDPAPIDKQSVIRLNRDTLYSSAVFDLDAGPVTVTLPPAGKRFMSMQVIDEDQYTHGVYYKPGNVVITRKDIGTRYVVVAMRTLVDPSNPKDMEEVHALQDRIEAKQRGPGKFEIPAWDQASQKKTREALLVLGAGLPDTSRMYGRRSEVDPTRFVIGAALGWGANPPKEALYLNVTPERNDGSTAYRLDVKDVPVDGFWSISLYNAEGYYEANPLNAYSLNNITAKKNPEGSVPVQFGGCDGKVPNCLPIMKGWNYMVRLYRPRAEILEGKWRFPEAEPVN